MSAVSLEENGGVGLLEPGDSTGKGKLLGVGVAFGGGGHE